MGLRAIIFAATIVALGCDNAGLSTIHDPNRAQTATDSNLDAGVVPDGGTDSLPNIEGTGESDTSGTDATDSASATQSDTGSTRSSDTVDVDTSLAGSDSVLDTESDTEVNDSSGTDTTTYFETETNTAIDTDTTTGSAVDSDTVTDTGMVTDTGTAVDSDTVADTGIVTDTETATDTGMATDTGTDTGTGTDTDTGTITDTGTATDTGCGDPVQLAVERHLPTVMMLLDQSYSLQASFSGTTRWGAIGDALFDAPDGAVRTRQSDVLLGYASYMSMGGSAGGECPILAFEAPCLNGMAAMQTTFDAQVVDGDTPTADAIDAVVTILENDPPPHETVIIFATDGELPDTCAVPNPQNGGPASITSAGAAFVAGFPFHVISVGTPLDAGYLTELANVGQGFAADATPGAGYHLALSTADLTQAFLDIIDGVRNCLVTVDTPIIDQMADQCEVLADGAPMTYNGANGWQLDAPDTIALQGSACDDLLAGDITDIAVTCPCNAVGN